MKTVLVAEADYFYGLLLKDTIEQETDFQVVWVSSRRQAMDILEKCGSLFFACILNFTLPDAPQGEIIKEIVKMDYPVIVFTDNLSDEIRSFIWSNSVADYAVKGDKRSVDYMVGMVKRLYKNRLIKVLVVEDSNFFGKMLTFLLKVHRYKTLNARNGKEALEMLENNPDIKLVVTDYSMPEMDGFVLTQKIREKYHKNELAIIGISCEGKNILAAKFIKNGANDFLIKQSFLTEEFYSRVTQSVEHLEQIERIREASIKDYLTGLYNRRYFFEAGKKLFASALRQNIPLVCGMIDIDHFKKVNDTYGHDAGDIALCRVSSILERRMRETDIVARLGGEEFGILAVNMDVSHAGNIFEELREKVEGEKINIDHRNINLTVSVGVTSALSGSLDDMVIRADRLLYMAKESGRNKVVLSHFQDVN